MPIFVFTLTRSHISGMKYEQFRSLIPAAKLFEKFLLMGDLTDGMSDISYDFVKLLNLMYSECCF